MNVCPICLFVNGVAAEACTRCGRFQFKQAAVAVKEQPTSGSDSCPSTKANTGQVSWSGLLPNVEQSTGMVALTPLRQEDSSGGSSKRLDAASKSSRLLVKPKLEVVRGERIGQSFGILEGRNVMGRTLTVPVDIDLTGQETPERVWSSRQHACILFDGRSVMIEDLNSLNGTFINRQRLAAGRQRVLQAGDIVQIGTVQLQLTIQAEKLEI